MDKGTEGKDYLKTWEALGFDFNAEKSSGENAATYNPFDDKQDKMIVNGATGQWVAYGSSGESGNVITFIDKFYNLCLRDTTIQHITPLAEEKKLPPQAFLGEVAFNPINNTYLIPFRNYEGEVRGLQYYHLGGKCKNVTGLPTQLWNTDELKQRPTKTTWLCEGAWDGIALKWAFKCTKNDDVAMALQGGNPYGFKEAFIPLFNKKPVYICYDKDEAGFGGQERVYNMLHRNTSKLKFLSWPSILREKYDVRDFILDNGGFPGYPKIALKSVIITLEGLMNVQTQRQQDDGKEKKAIPRGDTTVPTWQEVEAKFNKWLAMKDNKPLAVMFGTIFANKVSMSDPIWMFFVAPPAGMKTELISKLCESPRIVTTNKVTPAGLISGIRYASGEDPSLLVEANGKTLVITDFTTTLDGNRLVREEVFSIFRDVYDGQVIKNYAKFKKVIETHFGIIAAVTPVIDSTTSMNSSLGERFLKFRIDKDQTEEDEDERMFRAVSNVGKESDKGRELKDICTRFLEKKMPEKMPELTVKHKKLLMALAKFTARARAQLVEDPISGELQTMPFAEFGTRLVKQFVKIAIGISIYYEDLEFVQDRSIEIVKEIALDTCPQITVAMLKSIHEHIERDGVCTSSDICKDVNISATTVSRRTARMIQLNIVKKVSKGDFGVKQLFELGDKVKFLVKTIDLFPTPQKTPQEPQTAPRFTLKKPTI